MHIGNTWYFGGFPIMSTNVPVTVAYGEGIGPEIMEALELTMIDNRGVTLRSYNGSAGYKLSQGQ
jgi:hypothetical protein